MDLPRGSIELIYRLKDEKSVLLVPDDYFEIDHHIRVGYGGEPEVVRKGLSLASELMSSTAQ